MELQECVMELSQKLMVGFQDRQLGGFLRQLGVAQDQRRIDESFPLDLGENVSQKVVINLHLLLHHFLSFDTDREAVGDSLDVG
ncbi:hypothetical protein SLA2020_434100 [Shorea laevis]